MPAAPPEIGPFRVLGPLGQGGMGTVWLAEDPRLGRRVAIKLFAGPEARSEYARDQLLREARAAAALSHASIAAVHDVLDVDGQVAVVFEYVEGETLAARIARGPLAITAVARIALQLAEALNAAHERGIVHRDLKPPNIVVTRDGSVKVLDFGVARVLPAATAPTLGARTTAGGFVGTIGYAAPEQCLGEAGDARADIFSLGVVMYEALTGERPFPGADATTVMRAILRDAPPHVAARMRHVPEPLDRLIARMLAAEPAKRPQTAGEISAALHAMGLVPVGPLESPAARRRAWATAALVGVALLTGALVSSLASNRPVSDAVKPPPVVAVMPLTNVSADSSKDYLALGVADSLITRLAALPSITVLSRAAVSDARRRSTDLPALAAELDATYLVDGSVQQIADGLRISVNLVTRTGAVEWADTVEGRFEEVFELQTRLASILAKALSVRLSASDRASLAHQPTMNADALAAYWKGRAFLDRRDIKGNIAAALAALDEAVRLDSRFADAHAARGEAFWSRYLDTRNPDDARAAVDAGTTALRLNPYRAEVRFTLAVTLAGTGELDAAIEELQQALALRPNFEDARLQLGRVLARQGRTDEAVAEFRNVAAFRPDSAAAFSALGSALFDAGRYQEAAQAFERVTTLQPDNAIAHQQVGVAYHSLGEIERAMTSYQAALAIRPYAPAFSNLGAIHHERGEYANAINAYQQALSIRPNARETHRNLGDALARSGRKQEAQRAYARAVTLAETDLKVNPKDPRILASLAVYLQKAGRGDAARNRAAEAMQLAATDFEVLRRVAQVHALAGRADAAIDVLDLAVQNGFSRQAAAAEEEFESLRGSQRFQSLVQSPDK